ncbi:hypothetical protein CPB85DRAFT_536344 [Mucidula mucida]|nr:hypothetical protein CPB85DRAFT_536344 [Mucidula mucida]
MEYNALFLLMPSPQFSTGIKSSQPTASPPMRISSESGWAHDLCSCGDHTGTCLTATLCPCIVFGRNSDRLEHLRKTGRPHPDPYDGGCCSDACVVYASCIPCCGCWKMHSELRGEVRGRYTIEKSDKWYQRLAPMMCCALGLVQESRQIQCEEERIGVVV